MSDSTSTQSAENPGATAVRFQVLAGLCAAASIAYLSRNVLGLAVADGKIVADLGLSKQQTAWTLSAFFWSYAACQIPGGWFGQRHGSRVALAIFAVVWSISTALMGLSFGFVSLFIALITIGTFQAGLFPNSANSISKWFPRSRCALPCGMLGGFMSLGGAGATALAGFMLGALALQVDWMSWRWVFVLFAVPGLIWAVWFYLWFRDRPEQHRSVNQSELNLIHESDGDMPASDSHEETREPTPWSRIFASGTMWLICGQQFFRGAGYIFYSTWFPKFLRETRGVTTEESGYLSSLPLLAVVIGCPVGGVVVDWVYKKTGSLRLSRQGVASVAMLSCAGFIGLAYFANDARSAVLLISAGSFCASCGGPCGYTITIDVGGKHIPMVFSIMNMTGNFGAAMCPVVVERFQHFTGDWNAVLFLFVGFYMAAALFWALLNPKGTICDD